MGQARYTDFRTLPRPAVLRLQIPHQHRPTLRLHPGHGGDFGVSGGRASSPAGRQHEQYQFRGLGRQCLSIRAHVEHVFAHQKNRFNLFIRTIGLARTEAKLTLCNLAYNFNRLIFHVRLKTAG